MPCLLSKDLVQDLVQDLVVGPYLETLSGSLFSLTGNRDSNLPVCYPVRVLFLLFNSSQMFTITLLYNNIIRNNLGDWMRNRIVIPINTSPLVLLYTLYDYMKTPSQWRTNDEVERNRNVIISSKV